MYQRIYIYKICNVFFCVAIFYASFSPFSLSHVCVSMKIMEKLLSELTTDRRQLLAESFLDMVHDLLHANQLFYHNLAANSVSTVLITIHKCM